MKRNNGKYLVLIVIFSLLIAIGIGCLLNISIDKTYEYALNGEIKESKECYQREDGVCFCKEGNNFIQVDNYYEKEE